MERHGTQWQEHTELRMVWHANFLEFLESSKDNCGKFPEAFWSITRCIYRAHIPRQKRQNKSNSPLLSLCNRFRSYRCESDTYQQHRQPYSSSAQGALASAQHRPYCTQFVANNQDLTAALLFLEASRRVGPCGLC